jgi:hypothetical protein
MTDAEYNERYLTCHKCEATDKSIGGTATVDTRYSFGVYAGVLCEPCCSSFRDNCGVGQPQGSPQDLDEPYWEEA